MQSRIGDRARRNADEDAFLLRQPPRSLHRLVEVDVEHFIDDRRVVDRRNEARADPLEFVRRVRTALQHLRLDGHHRNHFDFRITLLEHLTDAGHRAAGSDACYNGVDFSAGVAPDFFSRRLAVDLRIGRIVELLGAPSARRLGFDLLGDPQRLREAFRPRSEDKLCAESLQQFPALDGERVRHDQDALVAFRCGDERQADAGVATGGFDDRVLAGFDLAAFFRVVDHGNGDAVLDRGEWVEGFEFDDHLRPPAEDAMQSDHGRVADQLCDVVVDLAVLHFSSRNKKDPKWRSGPEFKFVPKTPTSWLHSADSNRFLDASERST